MDSKKVLKEKYFNYLSEISVLAATITANYQLIGSISDTYPVSKLMIENTLDQDVVIKIASTTATLEKTIQANRDYTFDELHHYGSIYIKASSTLPSTGKVICSSW